jgi:hypothetical protein
MADPFWLFAVISGRPCKSLNFEDHFKKFISVVFDPLMFPFMQKLLKQLF